MQNFMMKLMMNPKVLNLLTKNPRLLQVVGISIALLAGLVISAIVGLIFSNIVIFGIVFGLYIVAIFAMIVYASKKIQQTQQQQMEMMASVFGAMFTQPEENSETSDDILPSSFDETDLKNMIEEMKKQS